MELSTEDLPGGVTRAILVGRLDIDGAQAVDLRLNALAGSRKALVIDISDVSYVASMGLRTLMMAARANAARGGKLAVANPQPTVGKVLDVSGTSELIAVHPTLESAVAAVSG